MAHPVQSWRLMRAMFQLRADRCGRLVLQMHGRQVLHDTLEVCRALHMMPFLAWGTLLGYYRDSGFIAHDTDIDLGVLAEDFRRKSALIEAMARKRYVVYKACDYFVSFCRQGCPELRIDVFVFYEKNGQIASSLDEPHLPDLYTYYFPADIFTAFQTVTFLKTLDVLVPVHTERFLEVAYGDWRTPQKEFHYLYGPRNLVQEAKPDNMPPDGNDGCTPL
jgi:hypothetical protein